MKFGTTGTRPKRKALFKVHYVFGKDNQGRGIFTAYSDKDLNDYLTIVINSDRVFTHVEVL